MNRIAVHLHIIAELINIREKLLQKPKRTKENQINFSTKVTEDYVAFMQ